MTPQKRAEYLQLFREFAANWLNREEGERHVRLMQESAAVGRANFQRLLSAVEKGEDVGTAPLRMLLPHADSPATRAGGMWISHAPAMNVNVEGMLSSMKWIPEAELPAIAAALLHFIQTSNTHPDQLPEACQNFARMPHTKGLQSGRLTPILSALRPEAFLPLSNRLRRALNYFADVAFSQALANYPRANKIGLELIAEVTTEMLELAGRYDLHPTHLFDLFSHYLALVGHDVLQSSAGSREQPESRTPFDRNSAESAADVLAMLYPETEVRHACMEYLAQTVQFASTLHGNNWGLTLHPREIRLNVGPVEVLTLRNNEVRLLLDAESLAPQDRKTISPPVEFSNRRYRSVPGEKGIGMMGVKEFIKLRDQLWESHQQFIRKASAKATRMAWAAAHSPGVLQYLREATGADIPDPEYAQTSSISFPEPTSAQPQVDDAKGRYQTGQGVEGEFYSLEALAAETGHPTEVLQQWLAAIARKGQAIIYGPPGTGKTYLAERLARHFSAGGEGMQELVQFHPSYSYEDFMIGIRPVSRGDVVEYPMQPGRFLEFCHKAQARRGTCVLVIDEINRADISRVFGELMYLLEYRDRTIELAGGRAFRIPKNVTIIGTMNTADRSIALLDYALRRRFAFVELRPDYRLLRHYHAAHNRNVEGLIALLARMNQRINNPHYELGISFFLQPNLPELLPSIWAMEIEPYLAEYFYDQPAAVEEFRWERVRGEVE